MAHFFIIIFPSAGSVLFEQIYAALAMVFTTLTVNSTCTWMTYQEELPDTAKKLRKF